MLCFAALSFCPPRRFCACDEVCLWSSCWLVGWAVFLLLLVCFLFSRKGTGDRHHLPLGGGFLATRCRSRPTASAGDLLILRHRAGMLLQQICCFCGMTHLLLYNTHRWVRGTIAWVRPFICLPTLLVVVSLRLLVHGLDHASLPALVHSSCCHSVLLPWPGRLFPAAGASVSSAKYCF